MVDHKSWLATFTGARRPEYIFPATVVHVNIAVYAFCFWLTQPVLPFLTEQLGADKVQFGYLTTFFSILQLAGNPLIGRLCDVHGARAAMLVSQSGAMLGYFLLGTARSVPWLFLSQVPMALMHAMHSAQALLSDMSSDEARAASLGRLQLSYGIGMVTGSLLGGALSHYIGISGVALFGAGAAALSIPMCLKFVPAGRPHDIVKRTVTSATETGGLSVAAALALIKQPQVRDLLAVNLLAGLAGSIQRSSFSMVAPSYFGLSPRQMGFTMAYGATLSVLVSTFMISSITSRLSEAACVSWAMAGLVACFSAYGYITTYTLLLVVMAPISVASSLLYTVFSSTATKVVSPEDIGTSIGLSHATRTLCNIVSPTLTGWLFKEFGFHALGIACAALCAAALGYTRFSTGFSHSFPTTPAPPSQQNDDPSHLAATASVNRGGQALRRPTTSRM